MTKFIGNYSKDIDLSAIITEVKSSAGDKRVFDGSYFDMSKGGFKEIMDQWLAAGYDMGSIEWFNYYSGQQFNASHTDKFGQLFNAIPVKVWVSEIRPGKCFPKHWDADSDTSEYVEGKMVRYQMFLEDYKIGHYFLLEDLTLVGYKAGDVFQWQDYKEWHAGGNIGFEPKFIFNFLGFANS